MRNWEEHESMMSEMKTDADHYRDWEHHVKYVEGPNHPDKAWLAVGDLDCYVKNPFYEGPKVPHPME
jgi:hypothetical protein